MDLSWEIGRQAEQSQGRVAGSEVREKGSQIMTHDKSYSPFFRSLSVITSSPTCHVREEVFLLECCLYFSQLNYASGLCRRGSDAVLCSLTVISSQLGSGEVEVLAQWTKVKVSAPVLCGLYASGTSHQAGSIP